MDNWIIRLKTTDKGQKYLAKSRGNRVKVAEQKALAVGQWKLKKNKKEEDNYGRFSYDFRPIFSSSGAFPPFCIEKLAHGGSHGRSLDRFTPDPTQFRYGEKSANKRKENEKKAQQHRQHQQQQQPRNFVFSFGEKKKQLVFTDVSTCCHSNWVRYRWTSQKSYWNKKRN